MYTDTFKQPNYFVKFVHTVFAITRSLLHLRRLPNIILDKQLWIQDYENRDIFKVAFKNTSEVCHLFPFTCIMI